MKPASLPHFIPLSSAAPSTRPQLTPLGVSVSQATSAAAADNAHPTPGARCTPTVSVKREGERIRQIIVTCACGETICLECLDG